MSTLTTNQKLAVAALALGALAVVASVAPRRTATIDPKALLTRVELEHDHVLPDELAGWIIAGRADYRLIDIRSPAAFAAYHIPTAENVPLSRIADGALPRTDLIVLYGDGGIHAAQAWMVMSALGYRKVYTLKEGLDAWREEVLHPAAPADPTAAQQARFERAVQVARFFGGAPRAAASAAPAVAAPALPAPAVPSVVPPPPLPAPVGPGPAKKKREGC
jgi:rhodanese-related sulfurtransferase